MDETKNKKKTLTISSSLTKKIDIGSLSKGGKKSFAIEKKNTFKPTKNDNKKKQTLKTKKKDKELLESLDFVKDIANETISVFQRGSVQDYANLMNEHWNYKMKR